MHFPRLAIVLMAAALSAVANAGGGLCTHMNAKKPVPSVEADMIWMNRAVVKLMNGMLGDLLDIMKGTPRKRDEEAMILYWLDCQDNETCLLVQGNPMCFNEKTTVLRMADGTTINITNGDMTMSDNTKGNFVTNTGPIVEYSKRLVMEKAKSDPEKYKSLGNAKAGTMVLWGPKAASTAAVPGLKSGSESGGVPVVSVVEAMVTVGASPTTVAFSSSSSSSTVTATASVTLASASSVTGSGNTTASTGTVAQSSKPAVETSWDGVSTAGKLAVGGWVATVASAAVFVAMAVAV